MAIGERVLEQTRIPIALRLYLKAYAKQHHMRLEGACEQILTLFFQQQPWLQGLRWRHPLSNRTDAGERAGWAQFNLNLSAELAAQLETLVAHFKISKAAVLYTSLFWFAKFICPPVMPK